MIKTGANYSDIRQIKVLASNPKATAAGIAKLLNLPVKTVESFMVEGATDIKVELTPKKRFIPKTET